MKECDGKQCPGVQECPWHRVDALKKANKARLVEMETVLSQTEELHSKLEGIDFKMASRRSAKKAAKKA